MVDENENWAYMEEHEVKTVLIMDRATFKNSKVEYEASYFFCDLAEELYMDEQQMRDNDIRLKDAYRKKKDLYFGCRNRKAWKDE